MASLLFIGYDVHSKAISLDTFDRNLIHIVTRQKLIMIHD